MSHKTLALSSILPLTLVLAGCGAASASAATNSSSTPQYGGTAVYALPVQTPPNWFFPLISDNADTVVNFQTDYMMYEPLVYYNSKDQFDPKHGLAQSVTWNKSDTVYTVTLNPKWHWSNGRPVTAQDVAFTWSIMKAASEPNTNYPWAFSGEGSGGIPTVWKSVVATGLHTVEVTTTEPRNPQWFIRNGLDEIIPVPKSVWDKYPTNMVKEMAFINRVANSPLNAVYHVVDGPYRLSNYQPNNFWDFVPNSHYDGHRSYLSKVVFKYETSSASEFAALKTGTVNVGYLGYSLLGARRELTRDVLSTPYQQGFDYIQPNFSPKAPHGIGTAFSQLPVREALQLGIDERGIIQHIYHGYGVIDDSALAPLPKTPFVDSALQKQPYPYNPGLGKKILERHGWQEVDGVMTKDGIKLEFTLDYASGSQSGSDMVQLFKSDWAKEGIIVNLDEEPFDTVVSYGTTDPSAWAMVDWSSGSAWTYGNDPYPTGGSLFISGAGENGGSYSNRTMNRLIQATYDPSTTTEALKRLYAYEAYTAENLPVIFLPMEPMLNVHSTDIHGTVSTFDTTGDVLHPNYWWISK